MTGQLDDHASEHRHGGPDHTPRLRLKRKAPKSGAVDGAWWPRSDDLGVELPDLLTVLTVRLGDISRVCYRRSEWRIPPRKIRFGDQLVRLDGYDRQPAGTLSIAGSAGAGLVLLVVAADSADDDAHAVMADAAASGSAAAIRSRLQARAAQ